MTNDDFVWDEEDFKKRYKKVKEYVVEETPLNNAAVTAYKAAESGLSSKLDGYASTLEDLSKRLTNIGTNKAEKGAETRTLSAVVDDLSNQIKTKADKSAYKLTYMREGYGDKVTDVDPLAELNAILEKTKSKNKHFTPKGSDYGLTGFAPSANVVSASVTVVDLGATAASFSFTGTKIAMTGFSATLEKLKESNTECLAQKLIAADTEVGANKGGAVLKLNEAVQGKTLTAAAAWYNDGLKTVLGTQIIL